MKTHKPSHRRPQSLSNLSPVDSLSRGSLIVVSKTFDRPQSFFCGQEPSLGGVVVELPIDPGSSDDREKTDHEEENLVSVKRGGGSKERDTEGEQRA